MKAKFGMPYCSSGWIGTDL